MNNLILFSTGAIFTLIIDWLYKLWCRRQMNHRLSKARVVLKNHKLTPLLYFATIGIDNTELRGALDEFAFRGYIIVNTKNEMVGKICPSTHETKKPNLRVIVSNDGLCKKHIKN